MADGVFVNEARPKSKRALKEAVEHAPDTVVIETTSAFSSRGNFGIKDMRPGESVTFVGPDPYTKRTFYGTIKRLDAAKFKVS